MIDFLRDRARSGRPTTVAAAFAGAGLLLSGLMACVQDPTGTEAPPEEEPVLQLMSEAEEYFRRGQYADAAAAFGQALALDSSLSMAYYGQAKATVALSGLDRVAIREDLEKTQSEAGLNAFLDHPDSILTLRLQVSKHVNLMLGKLTDRDSLTRWHRYLTADIPSAEDLADPHFQARHDFMAEYLAKADLDTPGYRKSNAFPLSDLRMPASNLAIDYLAFQLVYSITRLYDLDGNDTIDTRDSLMKKLKFGNSGGFELDSLSAIGSDLENDSVAQADLNALIANMSLGLKDPSHLAGLIGSDDEPDQDTAGYDDSTDTGADLFGETVYFYQFGDKKDNDGDGCVDEEILDDMDNDLDGFVDEDARIIPANKPDGVDNDRDGRMDPVNPASGLPGTDSAAREALVGIGLYPAKPHVLGYVHAYLAAANQLAVADALTDWVKIKKGASDADMAIRLAVQKDSLAVRIPAGGPVPDSLKAKLEHAKNAVGGCWRNYP